MNDALGDNRSKTCHPVSQPLGHNTCRLNCVERAAANPNSANPSCEGPCESVPKENRHSANFASARSSTFILAIRIAVNLNRLVQFGCQIEYSGPLSGQSARKLCVLAGGREFASWDCEARRDIAQPDSLFSCAEPSICYQSPTLQSKRIVIQD